MRELALRLGVELLDLQEPAFQALGGELLWPPWCRNAKQHIDADPEGLRHTGQQVRGRVRPWGLGVGHHALRDVDIRGEFDLGVAGGFA